MAILQLTTKKENSLCFNFLEEKIREESKKLIESIYADEVRQFLERMSAVVDEKENRLVVRNGYHKSRTVQTSCGNIEVTLPRVDDRKATEKFVSKILPPFVRKTPTVETLKNGEYFGQDAEVRAKKKATQMIRDMHMADTRENALKAYDKFIEDL